MEQLFRKWLEENTELSESSIGKYVGAIRTITKDMLSEGVINKNLYNVTSAAELCIIMKAIYSNSFFDKKDTRGNKMYSNALNQYYEYLKSK